MNLKTSPLVRGLLRLAAAELIILAGAGLIALFAGWRSYSIILLVAGVIVFSIGPFTMMGSSGLHGRFDQQYIQTMEPRTRQQHALEFKAKAAGNHDLLWASVLLGSLTILIAALLQ